MESTTIEQLKAHLMATDEEYRRLSREHSEYARLIDDIEARPHLTAQDEMEEHRLKKLKLHCKDQMELIMSRYRPQESVA